MRLPKVLDELASFGTHERSTWEMIARRLRDGGDLPRTKRGHGAGHVTASDLATLVIAGMGASSAVEASAVVKRLRALSANPCKIDVRRYAPALLDLPQPIKVPASMRPVEAVVRQRTFGQAMDALMANGPMIHKALTAYAETKSRLVDTDQQRDAVRKHIFEVALTINGPKPSASLWFQERHVLSGPEADNHYPFDRTEYTLYHGMWGFSALPDRLDEEHLGWTSQTVLDARAIFRLAALVQNDEATA